MMIFMTVAVLSLIQSLFGVGLLLFGTPILLLFGVEFRDALWLLLPASLTISTLQIAFDRRVERSSIGLFLAWCIPSVCIGLFLVLTFPFKVKIDYFIIVLLFASSLLRFSHPLRNRLGELFLKHQKIMLSVIGLVHGVTNMGGSLLSVYAATRATDKYAVRQFIAVGYALFSASQIAVLFFTKHGEPFPNPVPLMLTSGAVFMFFGRGAFSRLNHSSYNMMLNLFLLCCATALTLKNIL